MFMIFSIIIVIVSMMIIWKRWFNFIHWDSQNWNKQKKQFVHHWKPNHRIMSLKVFWKFIKEPSIKWPKQITIHPAKIIERQEQLRITNIGHATFLIQTSNINMITDPVFSKRAGPLGIFGPKRVVEAGIPLGLLPPIDVIFISHNHYDHLDKFSVIQLAKSHPATFIVPLGIKKTLLKWGIKNPIVELDWWQSHMVKDVKITATPAQHWSKRGLFDTNKTLWMGGLFESSKGSVFFAGDTGLGPHFQEISERFQPINIGLLPIGAHKPRSMMKEQHMDPKDALLAHKDLKTHIMIPIHYDVFALGKESFLEAEQDLILEAKNAKIPQNEIQILKVAESFDFYTTHSN